ncbi:MAG: ABC transporter permease [Nocardioidaceae bacterium]
MTTVDEATDKDTNSGLGATLRERLRQLLAFGALVVIFVAFSFASPYFFTYTNVTGILFSAVVIGTLAVGTTFVIITAGIDLSIGTGMTLCAVMSGVFLVDWGLPLALGVVCAILFGGLVGFVNGFNVAVLNIPPFIATLAMMLAAGGLALVLSDSQPIYFSDVEGYSDISTGNIISGVEFPNAVVILAVIAIIAAVLLNRTIIGRYVFAIGSSQEATALAGVNVRGWKILIYTFAGLFIGLAGVLISARLGSAQPALGLGYELQAIAAVVLGGTSLYGGRGTIVGTVIGTLIIAVINNGLQIISVPQEWQDVVLGCVVLVAVYFDQLRLRGA